MLSNREMEIKEIATKFRKMMEGLKSQSQPSMRSLLPALESFPHGNCGDTSELLQKYLHYKGYSDVEYVNGQHGGMQTHAWLEVDGLIIDITADQFEEIDDAVMFTRDRSFHKRFKVLEQRKCDFGTYSRLAAAYRILLSHMTSDLD